VVPLKGDPVGRNFVTLISRKNYDVGAVRWLKIFDNRLSRLDTIPGGDRQKDFRQQVPRLTSREESTRHIINASDRDRLVTKFIL